MNYEIESLAGNICQHCGKNFQYQFHANKKRLKKFDLAFYELLTQGVQDNQASALAEGETAAQSFYLHFYCFEPFVLQVSNDDQKLIIHRQTIDSIKLKDRYGKPMTKVNYVRKVPKILYQEAIRRFGEQVKWMYSEHVHFSFHCCSYSLKNKYLNDFTQKKDQFQYKGLTLGDEITPEHIGRLLSMGEI